MAGRRVLAAAAGLLGAGALLLLRIFPPDRYPAYPPCPFHALTGLQCPGCGATRALAALLHGDVAAAWRLNALFVAALPALALYVVFAFAQNRRGERRCLPPRIPDWATGAMLALALLFTIWRNIP